MVKATWLIYSKPSTIIVFVRPFSLKKKKAGLKSSWSEWWNQWSWEPSKQNNLLKDVKILLTLFIKVHTFTINCLLSCMLVACWLFISHYKALINSLFCIFYNYSAMNCYELRVNFDLNSLTLTLNNFSLQNKPLISVLEMTHGEPMCYKSAS